MTLSITFSGPHFLLHFSDTPTKTSHYVVMTTIWLAPTTISLRIPDQQEVNIRYQYIQPRLQSVIRTGPNQRLHLSRCSKSQHSFLCTPEPLMSSDIKHKGWSYQIWEAHFLHALSYSAVLDKELCLSLSYCLSVSYARFYTLICNRECKLHLCFASRCPVKTLPTGGARGALED